MKICFDDPPQSQRPSKEAVDGLAHGSQQRGNVSHCARVPPKVPVAQEGRVPAGAQTPSTLASAVVFCKFKTLLSGIISV